MFDPGEKVVLIASSYHKKTGPRKNSIGYITTLNSPSSVTLNNLRITVISTSIQFLRYGNEKKDRFETKQVVTVFPVLQKNTSEQLNNFIHIISSNKYSKNWDEIRLCLNVSKNVPIVLAVPIHTPEISLKSCSNQEFSCWFESYLTSQAMNSFINDALGSCHFFQNKLQSIKLQTLVTLQTMMVNRHTKQTTIKAICENVSERSKWINILRIITITLKHIKQKVVKDKLVYILNHSLYEKDNKGGVTTNNVYSILVPYIFCQSFPKFREIYRKNEGFNKIIKRMEDTKDMMLALSTKNLNKKNLSK